MASILVIDDNESVREGVASVLHRMGHKALVAPGGTEGIHAFRTSREEISLVITDLRMEPVDGMEVLRAVRGFDDQVVVILITAHGTIQTAVEAMREGAWDFIEKPFPAELLRAKVARALEVSAERRRGVRLVAENAVLREAARGPVGGLERLVGRSEAMQRLHRLIRKVAPTDSTVHVHGESGTGKELVAAALHDLSPRSSGPFIKVNCGAIQDTLLESELFGHEKGAFTDAVKRRIGRFEAADGGTLFLDEVGDISTAMQVKLLRVLQERTFERVGGEKSVSVDVRIVTATNRDLAAEVQAGRFREDLYYRLNIIPITIPPLRERRDDIGMLAEHFLGRLATRTRSTVQGISPEALQALQRYDWPGNVRELENVIEQAMVFADGDSLQPEDLPPVVSGRRRAEGLSLPDDGRPLPDILEDLERQLIVRALGRASGVKTEAARLLGIKTPALYYKLEKYGLLDTGDSGTPSG